MKPVTDQLTKAFGMMGFAHHHPKRRDKFEEEQSQKTHELDDAFKRRVEQAKKEAHRLKDVFAAPLKMVADFIPPVYCKSKEDSEFISDVMKKNFLFEHMGSSEQRAFIDAFDPTRMPKGTEIIRQGDTGDFFYLIRDGTVKFFVDGKDVGSAGPGQGFGELALLYDCPRAATCIAETDCVVFRVDQRTVRRLLAGFTLKGHDETKELLRQVGFMKNLEENILTKVAMALSTVTYEKDDFVVRKGEEARMFVIVKEGALKVTDIELGGTKYDDLMFGPGDSFGENAIINNAPLVGNVRALEKTTCLTLNSTIFTKLFGDLSALMAKGLDTKKLALIPFPDNPEFSKAQLDVLASAVEEVQFKKGHEFFVQGVRTKPALYLLRSGSVTVKTSKTRLGHEWLGFALGIDESKSISKDTYFGNDLMDPDEDGLAVPKYTVRAETDCVAGVITWESFEFVFGPRAKPKGEMGLEDLQKHRILGAGTFGKVWLVSQKGTKDAYALKIQVKRQLIDYGQAEGVTREKNIMERLDHPFIIKLVRSYQDNDHVYMLTKLYQGGELQSVMHTERRNGIPEWAARFYCAGVLEGLGYMHRLHVLYRDLKPENVLLDNDGYTVIVDLGFAKIVPDKTFTFCGTPLYLAPEVILQRGHDKGCDHWSWGVMLYEMIVGITPFYEDRIEQMTLFKRIVRGRFEFPGGNFMSESSKDLIRRILVPNPRERLGSFAVGDIDIREHEWFDEIEWEKLARKELSAPWKPDVEDPLDGTNFASWEHLEKESEEHFKPLSAKEQYIFKEF